MPSRPNLHHIKKGICLDAPFDFLRIVFQTELSCSGVRSQTFAMRQHAGSFAPTSARLVLKPESNWSVFGNHMFPKEKRNAPCGWSAKAVVGAGAIVTQAFTGITSHENRAGVADFSPTLADSQPTIPSIGRNIVDDFAGFVQVFSQNHCAAVAQ